jgi:hypothetical protein
MNFHDYLNRQNNEDRRAFVIHYPAKSGKTSFARRICETRQDAYLLDLQGYFREHPELPAIQQCNPSVLKNLLLSLDRSERVLVVDNPDFLLNTWSKEEKRTLVHWLRYDLRSPVVTDVTFVLVIQTDDIIANSDMFNSRDEPRVLALNQFDAL